MMLINGVATTSLDARDRGLHYGDGVFTTARVARGEVLLWERHVARLQDNCARLAIPAPDAAFLRAEAQQLCVGVAQGILKVTVTRGVGGRGYASPQETQPTRLVALHPWPDYPQTNWDDGIALRVNALRLARQPALAGVKHLNRLEQVLARAEWNDPAIVEGLMCNEHGDVIEATAANVFAVRNGELITPDLNECGVAGVMRALVLEMAAALGVPGRIARLTLDDVRDAGEIFLTNSVMGIVAVRQLESTSWGAAAGRRFESWSKLPHSKSISKPHGALTQQLQSELIKRVPGYA